MQSHAAWKRLTETFFLSPVVDDMRLLAQLKDAIIHGAVTRVAAPMVGGLGTSFVMELLVYPATCLLWKKRELARA
jgi:Cu/Ag efflux pump CusA